MPQFGKIVTLAHYSHRGLNGLTRRKRGEEDGDRDDWLGEIGDAANRLRGGEARSQTEHRD